MNANGKIQIWSLQDLGKREVSPGDTPGNNSMRGTLIWSPDSRYIAYNYDERLWKMPVVFGDSAEICELPGTRSLLSGSWDSRGKIVFCSWRGGMYEVSANGGKPTEILSAESLEAVDFHGVDHLPDGSLIFDIHTREDAENPLSGILRMANGVVQPLIDNPNAVLPQYSDTGHILYSVDSNTSSVHLMATPYSVPDARLTGEPFSVADRGRGAKTCANGILVYSREHKRLSEDPEAQERFQAIWLDRQGQVVETIGDPNPEFFIPSLSPDEASLAYVKVTDGESDIWLVDLASGIEQRITFDRAKDRNSQLAWTRDGKSILFSKERDLVDLQFAISIDGTGQEQELFPGRGAEMSPDGQYLVYTVHELNGDNDIWMCRLEEPGSLRGELNRKPLLPLRTWRIYHSYHQTGNS